MKQSRQRNLAISTIGALIVHMILGLALLSAQDTGEQKENINYKWAFAARIGQGDARRVVTIGRDTALKSGDEFKLYVHLLKKGYVYIVHRSPANELTVLFPYSVETSYDIEKNYYIPKGRDWYKLDAKTGDETFYILASTERLTDLENSLRDYSVAQPENKKTLATAIVDQIKDIKKRYRTFATLAERPISIGGNVRGTKTSSVNPDKIDIATLATEISANNFYSKTITIDHK